MNNFELEKWIWTEKDFEKMGWHDAAVYGIELRVQIDSLTYQLRGSRYENQ